MKCIIYTIVISAFLLQVVSCKKEFLDDVNDGSILLRQDYVVDLKTTGEYMGGIYISLSTSLFSGYPFIYPDLVADNIKPIIGSSGFTPLISHYNWAQQANEVSVKSLISTDFNCNGLSYDCYEILRGCSFVIEKANEYKDQDVEKANTIKGQALAIRALVNFYLVNIFSQSYSFTADGSHPGIALVTTSNWTDPIIRRNTVAEVYNQLITDLKGAIDLLPANTATILIMNRNAARALLARVYLFKGDYLHAKDMATGVSKDVPIMTANYPAKLFTAEETEALFQLPPSTSAIGSYTTTFASYYFRSRIQFLATSDIALLLGESPNDQRKKWVTASSGNWNIVKYPSGATVEPITDKANAYYQTILRSSEMYLTAAECYAKLNNTDSAIFYLNAIQRRANAIVTAPSVTGAPLMDSIYKERRKELAFEGLRMFDLQRLKMNVVRKDAASIESNELIYPSRKAIAPIPGLDVKLLGLTQNDDY